MVNQTNASKHRCSDNTHIFFGLTGISEIQNIWAINIHGPRHRPHPHHPCGLFPEDTGVLQGSLHLWHHTIIFLILRVKLVGITVTHTPATPPQHTVGWDSPGSTPSKHQGNGVACQHPCQAGKVGMTVWWSLENA